MEAKSQPSNQNQQVAIVGIGCRYGNGVDSVKKFWEMLVKGLDCTTPLPPDRFDVSYFLSPGEKTTGKMYNQNGGYISQDPYMFDRQFFKVPPEEAAHLDPQVRLLLEVTWEALENAGIPASSLRGSNTGVYMGVTAQEYTSFASTPYHNMNQYSNSGTNSCMVSNRISYEFDLRGPSFSVDTACSSSLYSIFLACEALKQKSCPIALAGGVNLILAPSASIGFCQAGMLSGDGKCKSFDRAADGYSRSEGAGVIVLKPLDDALKNGDRVYAVLRGGALSNDGRTPGIANPSFGAQIALVKTACHRAQVDPCDIVYAEAHGTGTRVGDTTEAGALGEVMGRPRGPLHPPLYIGSVKSNLGHSEGAAGVAGVIKVALCLHQRSIPSVVHFKTPNENVDFEALNIRIPKTLTPWPKEDSRFLACCSSFGFGGANANLVLERLNTSKGCMNSDNREAMLSCLLLSAASPDALNHKIHDWKDFFTEAADMKNTHFYESLYTAAVRSHHHTYRIGFSVRSREDALQQLQIKLENVTQDSARYVEGVAPVAADTKQQIVFVFSGMGTQWWGMARELMHTQSRFASKMKVIDDLLHKCGAKWSLVYMLSKEENHEKINQTDISQPCLCAVAIGLLDLWREYGVVPDAVVGHSVGEVAAAYAAGFLSLEHAVKLIYRRGRELRKTSGSGKMVAVLHRVEDALHLAKNNNHGRLLDVAAINSPGQAVFSGDSSSVEGLVNDLKTDNVKCVVLKVNNAFHSKQQDVVKKPFIKNVGKFLKIQNVAARSKTLPMMSTVTGRYLTVEEANSPEYWFQNVRQKVSFMDATQKLAKDGYRVFVEIGPHPSLLPALRDTCTEFQDTDGKFVTIGSLVRPRDTNTMARDSENMLLSQMRLHANGIKVDFRHWFRPNVCRVVSIPHYPWQREKCSNITQTARKMFLFPTEEGAHLLLGEPKETFYLSELPVKIWRADLNASTVPWVKDHVLQGAVIVPAAAFTETAFAAARSLFNSRYPLILSRLVFDRFMFAPDCEGCLESTVEETTSDEYLFTLRSHEASRKKWTQHCHLNINRPIGDEFKAPEKIIEVTSISQNCARSLLVEDFYRFALECGFQLGPTFRGVKAFSVSEDGLEALVYAEAPASVKREFHRYVYHPAFMDSILQSFAVLLIETEKRKHELSGETWQSVYRVPKSMSKVILHAAISPRVIIHLKMNSTNLQSCDIDVADAETKTVFCSVKELVFETIQTDKVEPQVWSTLWENVGSLTTTVKPLMNAPVKKVVIFTDGTDTSTSLIRFMKDDDVNVIVLDGKGDTTQKVMKTLHENPDSDILVMMKTDASCFEFNSKSVMSQTQFEKFQDDGPLLCSAVFNGLIQMVDGIKPPLLLITKGGCHAKQEDDIHPFLAVLPVLVMTLLSHEDPSIRGNVIDLPITASSEECANIIREIVCRAESLLHNENGLAVRGPTPSQKENQGAKEKEWELFSPRVKAENISKSPGIVPTTYWSAGAQTASDENRIHVKKSRQIATDEVDSESFMLKVEAFTVYTTQSLDGENDTASHLCMYSGRADKKSDLSEVGRRYLGFKTCQNVLSLMNSKLSDVTKVPDFITSVEATSIAHNFFPSAIFFSQVLPIFSGMLLVFKLDSLDGWALATVRLAAALGAEAVVLKDDHEERHTNNLNASVRCVNEVDEGSIDVLFLSVRSSYLSTSLNLLLPKLKRNASVVIMERQLQKNKTRLQMLPPNMKLMMFNSYLPSALDGLTSGLISHTLSDLWKMFDPNTKGHLTCTLRNHRVLSSLTGSNAPIPEEEVIEVGEGEILLPLSLEQDDVIIDEHAAYFITGGTSGFGLKLLEWLVSRGARYIYIGSRRPMNDEIKETIQQVSKLGAHVQHIQMDISNVTDVERELMKMQECCNNWPTLKGIFHCAAVFSDGFLYNVTAESWNRVMLPKAYGALILHQLTQKLGIELDYLIMTSSIVSLIGSAGQASYCLANVFLNALSEYRHFRGLPATALQIGVISKVGFAARQDLVRLWENNGVGRIAPREVLSIIGCALSTRLTQLGISGVFNRKLYATRHYGLMMQHFKEKHGTLSLLKNMFHDRDLYLSPSDSTLRQAILKLPVSKAREKVKQMLCELLSQHLGLSDAVPYDASPISLGLDSLMASDFSQMINQQFEVNVGAVDLLNDKNTIDQLAKNITTHIMARTDDTGAESLGNGRPAATMGAAVIEGEAPESVEVKLVCFPSNGAGPSLFASWVQPLIQYGVQLLMVQLPGWEGRDDERPLTNMRDIILSIHDELVTRLSGTPFIFFGHSMGSLIAFEVAHLLKAEANISPNHLIISAWYPPTEPYPHPEELRYETSTFDRLKKTLQSQPTMFVNLLKEENVQFSFLDNNTLSNIALMRKLIPCIEAAIGMCKVSVYKHQKPLTCGITVLGGKQDRFVSPEMLDGWALLRSRKYPFTKITFPGKHMYLLTNTADVLKEIRHVCKSVVIGK